jgi:hypothetical protein
MKILLKISDLLYKLFYVVQHMSSSNEVKKKLDELNFFCPHFCFEQLEKLLLLKESYFFGFYFFL